MTRQPFESQPDIDALAPPSELTGTVPETNIPPDPTDYMHTNVPELVPQFTDLRELELSVAKNEYQLSRGEGPYSRPGPEFKVRDASGKMQTKRLEGVEIQALEKERLDNARNELAAKIVERVRSGNSTHILERLGAFADSIDGGASAAKQGSLDSRVAYANAHKDHHDSGAEYLDAYYKGDPADHQLRTHVTRHYDRRSAALDVSKSAHDQAWTNGHAELNSSGDAYLGSYADMVRGIADKAGEEHRRATQEAEAGLRNADNELNGWPLGTENTRAEVEAEDSLATAHDRINELSRRDEGRGILTDDYVVSRYRLEQRGIMNAVLAGKSITEYPALYNDDGGILLNTDAGSVIIYEDGSTSREEAGSGFVRRYGDGQVWQPDERQPAEITTDFDALDDTELETRTRQAFETWERSRNPADKDEAGVYLEEHTSRLNDQAYQHEVEIEDLDSQAGQLLEEIAGLADETKDLVTQRDALAKDPDHDPDELQELVDSINANTVRIDEAKTEGRDLYDQVDARRDDIRTLRITTNLEMYQIGLVSSELVAPKGSVERLGRTAVQETVESPPQILATGELIWNGVTINGIYGKWTVWPNGAARLREGNAEMDYSTDGTLLLSYEGGRTTYYNPDGSIDRVV